MKAARLHQPGSAENYVYEDAPDPVARAGEVLVRVKAVALNHLEAWAAKAPPHIKYDAPRTLGADVAGVVEQIGEGVVNVAPGDDVIVHPGVSCGTCRACLDGDDNLCPRYHLLGQGRDGGLAEYVVVPAANAFAKPANLSFGKPLRSRSSSPPPCT
jgi:NADPH:quinone reductase-like Zn-dependent oxidoreductase